MKRRNPGTTARAASTTPIADTKTTTQPGECVSSQQVSWWSVHEFVTEVLNQVNGWPQLGTPAWCSMANEDPVKWAALLDAAQHWALHLEINQEARAEASRDVSAAADWPVVSREINQRNDFYAKRPWMKRAAS